MDSIKLTIEQREKEGIVILDVTGRLTLGAEDLLLRQRLVSLLSSGVRNVIVNLKDVSRLDTSGLGTLVFYALQFRESGGRMVLLHLDQSHTKFSDVLKLDTEFETYRDEQEAVNSFFPERTVPSYDLLEFLHTTVPGAGARKSAARKD